MLMRTRQLCAGMKCLTLIWALAATLIVRPLYGKDQPAVTITAHPESGVGHVIPDDFIGLSYETSALIQTNAGYQLDPTDAVTRKLMHNLAPGVLRFGGNSVDELDKWDPSEGARSTSTRVLTKSEVKAALDLARATGWRVIWSVDLKTGDAHSDAEQVAYVYQSGSDVVSQIAIGNEPNLYKLHDWSSRAYVEKWQSFFDEIRRKTPAAVIAGWDMTAGAIDKTDWGQDVWDETATKQPLKADIALLTNHLYPLSSDKSPTIQDLLSSSTVSKEVAPARWLQRHAQTRHIPWRLSETDAIGNGQGGLPNVSDVFAAALWNADYMFQMAQLDAAGVNFHCGRGGGYVSAPFIERRINNDPKVAVQATYYGLLLFRQAAVGRLIPVDVDTKEANLGAYGVVDTDGTLRMTVINKSETDKAFVHIAPGARYSAALGMRLWAPNAKSPAADIRLGGAPVKEDGSWSPTNIEHGSVTNGIYKAVLSPASALLVTFPCCDKSRAD